MATNLDAGGDGSDHITDLPDDVLHIILAHLPTTAEATRTSILSRRWHRVWTGIPALSFRYDEAPASSSTQKDQLDRIDAALSGHAATATVDVERLKIDVSYGVPDARVARWLLFASRRLNGELRLASETWWWESWEDEAKEVAIPLCERVTSMSLCLDRTLQFPLHSATGAFTALVALELTKGFVDGGELGSTLSSRCPNLKKLSLDRVTVVALPRADLCIHSGSLEQLEIIAIVSHDDVVLQVDTPELLSFSMDSCIGIVLMTRTATALKRVATDAVAIMRRFDTIHELNLAVARTSILARRWRRVWAAVPELSFRYYGHESWRTAPVCLRVNQALAACSVPTVHRLHIAMPLPRSSRCSFWLHQASSPFPWTQAFSGDESATAIYFDLYGYILRFEQAAGTFTALSTLRIRHGNVDSRELEDVLSSRCPGLKELVLGDVIFIHGGASSGLSIRSDSLEHLEIFGYMEFHGRLEVNAPKLRFFSPRCRLNDDARIVAPMLSEASDAISDVWTSIQTPRWRR
ncbi:hypothetical protein HU200_051541 [Digitaria exilis]|uniref:F-box domain-containing protein n=1 Tax=Digitaria exilis TaxID=1010633 RepID=A0A835E810_9POAL|nr:hypothetical protein HU200_051541 [Digitaria exilis]